MGHTNYTSMVVSSETLRPGYAPAAAVTCPQLFCISTVRCIEGFLTECIVYFLNTVHCYNSLKEYCYYEIHLHRALCDFAVQKGYCCLKGGPPPQHIYKGIFCFETIKDL